MNNRARLKRLIFMITVVFVFLGYSPAKEEFTGEAASQTVKFPDSVLEKVIRYTINKPVGEIMKSDVEKITEINTNKLHSVLLKDLLPPGVDLESYYGPVAGIKSLEGLQHLVNLETLVIKQDYGPIIISHSIKDFSELKNLKKLKTLTLSGQALSSLDGLANLTNLTRLDLSFNGLYDVEELRTLTGLQELNLEGNYLKDLSALKNLINLEKLNLNMNAIIDVSPLENLQKLTDLSLGNLTYMTGDEGKKINAEPLSSLTSLKKLELTRIEDMTPLASLIHLEELTLSQNWNLRGFHAIEGMSKLKKLDLSATGLKRLDPVASLKNLESLDVSLNQIESIVELAGLKKLKILNVSSNSITTITPLNKLTELETIIANYNQISSIDLINEWKKLKYAGFSHNHITTLENFSPPPMLESIDFQFNIIDDRPMSASLQVLNLLKDKRIEVYYTSYNPFPDIMLRESDIVYSMGEYVRINESPFIQKGRFFVPIRFVSEILGAQVDWDQAQQQITIRYEGQILQLVLGETKIKVNGKTVEIDAAPLLKNNTTFVPVRFVSEQLGMYVEASGGAVIIVKNNARSPYFIYY